MSSSTFSYLDPIQRKKIYVVLDDINFTWTKFEIKQILNLWNKGKSIHYISTSIQREVDEIALLIMDLGEYPKCYFLQRDNGVNESNPVCANRYYRIKIENLLNSINEEYKMFEEFYEVDFIWDEYEVYEFDRMWNFGVSIQKISKKLKRNIIDCVLLLFDRSRKNFINSRDGGLKGFNGIS